MPPQMVFLSYSRRDAGIVRKVSLMIRAMGLLPWRDEESIGPGNRWRGEIAKSIRDCERVLLFWCRHSRDSAEVRSEYSEAIRLTKPLVPVLLDRVTMPTSIAQYQAIDLRDLTWWSHEIARRERYPWIIGLLCLLSAGAVALIR